MQPDNEKITRILPEARKRAKQKQIKRTLTGTSAGTPTRARKRQKPQLEVETQPPLGIMEANRIRGKSQYRCFLLQGD